MKNLKLTKINPKIDRKIVAKIGEMIYHSEGIDSVTINVNFKDGSTVGYKRSESKDAVERFIEEDEREMGDD